MRFALPIGYLIFGLWLGTYLTVLGGLGGEDSDYGRYWMQDAGGLGAFSLSTYLRIRYLKKVGLSVATTRYDDDGQHD